MNKKELISTLAKRLGMTFRKTASVLEEVFSAITEATKRDGRCLCGGHKFYLRSTKERAGRNPNTGEKITIPAKITVSYRKLVKSLTK